MSGQGDQPRRQKPGVNLSEEDVALWRYVTRGVTEAKGKTRVAAPPTQAREISPDLPSTDKHTPPPRRESQGKPQLPSVSPRMPEPVRAVPLERRKARRIARGGQEIEARLDLHGLFQDEACRALGHFIHRCSVGGLRTVLVITGKGAPPGADEPASGAFERRERGVLRRMVPVWLDGPDLRPLVISYAAAHVRHGGNGALYVTLRRRG